MIKLYVISPLKTFCLRLKLFIYRVTDRACLFIFLRIIVNFFKLLFFSYFFKYLITIFYTIYKKFLMAIKAYFFTNKNHHFTLNDCEGNDLKKIHMNLIKNI